MEREAKAIRAQKGFIQLKSRYNSGKHKNYIDKQGYLHHPKRAFASKLIKVLESIFLLKIILLDYFYLSKFLYKLLPEETFSQSEILINSVAIPDGEKHFLLQHIRRGKHIEA